VRSERRLGIDFVRACAVVLLAVAPPIASAHHPQADGPFALWNFEPWIFVSLVAAGALYVRGVAQLWRKAGRGRGVSGAQAASFGCGWSVLVLALLTPLDALAESQFWLHMVQHELLMVAAAPLFVASRPLEAMTWSLPLRWRASLGRVLHRPALALGWRLLAQPWAAWLAHAVAIWAWHAPALFGAALRSEAVHVMQHASFFATALLFWWSVLRPFSHGGRPDGYALASLFTTMLHTGALGALLTFSTTLWYPAYRTPAAGWSALEDQQLAGLVMWIPGGFVYVAVALAIAARWLDVRPGIPVRR
jgi:putative membrane protein